MRILAIKLKQIGDALLSEPALRLLHKTYPQAELTVIVNDYTLPMLRHAPYIDHIFGYDRGFKRLKFYSRFREEYRFVKKWNASKYDIVVNFSPGDRGAIYAFFTKARCKIGVYAQKGFFGKNKIYDIVLSPPHTHTVLQDMWLVTKALNLPFVSPQVRLYLSRTSLEKAEDILRQAGIKDRDKIVCVHPVANWLFKCWRADYMAEVINWLANQGIKIVITGGKLKKELEFIKEILKEVKFPIINLAGKLDLETLGAIIYYSDLFLGVDTAPMHMAAALNKPVIALFGPTGAASWGPWDNDLSYADFASPYEIKGTQTLGKHTVLQKGWDCVPCGKDGCNGSKISKCLHAITPEEVISVLKEKLGG